MSAWSLTASFGRAVRGLAIRARGAVSTAAAPRPLAPASATDDVPMGQERLRRSSRAAGTLATHQSSQPSFNSSSLGVCRIIIPADRAQYFLVSPKLLEGLAAMDNDDVTVLMVYNGPGITSKWQLGDIITALKKRKADLLATGPSPSAAMA